MENKELIDIAKEILEECKKINNYLRPTKDRAQPDESEQPKPKLTQDKQRKYCVGLLDPKEHIFRYVASPFSTPFFQDIIDNIRKEVFNNEIFNKLYEKDIYTSNTTSFIKTFNQSELDEFMKSEIILYLMTNYGLQIYSFNMEIEDFSDLDNTNYRYYIYYLSDNKHIIFFNGFLNCDKGYHLKLEDNINKAKLFNRADAIINVDRLHRGYNYKGWNYIKKDDPDLNNFLIVSGLI